jgi:hypothetical protein
LHDYYASKGEEKSIKIVADGKTVSSGRIVVCDLEDWIHQPPAGKVALDPERGRLSFPSDEIPEDVHVSYYYGFSSDLGGGFYSRPRLKIDFPENTITYKISKKILSGSSDIDQSIVDALAKWESDGKPDAIFEILDSEFYEMPSELMLPNDKTVAIISADKQRPVLKKMPEGGGADEHTIQIIGGDSSHLVIDGLLLDLSLTISEKLDLLLVTHSTLVPSNNSPSIRYKGTHPLRISLYRTICGSIITEGSEADCRIKPETELDITDSIIDEKAAAVNRNGNISNSMAIECYKIKIENSTVFGKVNVVLVDIVSNTIFTDFIRAERRQQGCMRFSYIPVGSEVPRRYRCQPEDPSNLFEGYNTCSKKVFPRFTSQRYGDAGYAQLHKYVSNEILHGGDNGAEMGAFNHLYQPQRINNLEASLEEYLRFGLDAAILSVNADNERRKL